MVSSEIIDLIYSTDSNIFAGYGDQTIWELEYKKNKHRTALTFEQFSYYLNTDEEMPNVYGIGGDDGFGIDFDLVLMLIDGKMLESKLSLESKMKSYPMPFFVQRTGVPGDPWGEDEKISMIGQDYSNEDLAQHVILKLPTKKGYQLEYLGKIYELMIRLEDAKKCFELQYECTGEPELKEYVEKLDKVIEEKNLRYPKNNNLSTEKLTIDTTLKIIKKTEENVRKYIFELYDGDIKKIWSRFPDHKKSVDERRQQNEKSLTPLEEKTPIQNLTMGQLSDIMFHSNNQRRSDRDDKCKKCGEKYLKKEQIFFQNIKNSKDKIICKNKQCFETQGGVHKNIPEELVSLFQLLTSVRNILTHAEEEDLKKDQISWQIRFNSIAGECRLVNDHLEKINANKKYA
jgi:uncharacterized protein YqgV (UPF0045/DUF77 family)